MAVIKCEECGKEVSEFAKTCPNCGYPINKGLKKIHNSIKNRSKKSFSKIHIVVLSVVSIAIIVSVFLLVTANFRAYNKGMQAFEKGNFEEAEKVFEKLENYKDSKNMLKKSQEEVLIANDKEAPQINNLPLSIVVKIGDTINFEKWANENEITITDNVSENLDYKIEDESVDFSKIGTYTVVFASNDEAGNIVKKDMKIIIQDYPVHEAYEIAANIDTSLLNKDSITNNYEYAGLFISEAEGKKVSSGSVYRCIAGQLEGFYWLGKDNYNIWGSDVVPIVFGFEKKEKRSDMEEYIDNASLFISKYNPICDIISIIDKLECSLGSYNYEKGEFSIVIGDLTKASHEMGITEKMLGYILAYLEEYNISSSFENNSYSCKLLYDREDFSDNDFAYYEDYGDNTKKITTDTYFYDNNIIPVEVDGVSKNEKGSEFSTNRGIAINSSENAVILAYGGTVINYSKNDDVLYRYSKENDRDSFEILETCSTYIVKKTSSKEMVFYFDTEKRLVLLLYCNDLLH